MKADQVYDAIQKTAQASAAAPQQNQQPPAAQVRKVDLPDDVKDFSRGAKNAKVTIVEFSDFQCPFCSRAEPTLAEVVKTYGDKVRLVWKHEPLPFHNRAEPAAEFTMEARAQKNDKGFWAAHDLLWHKECQGKADANDKQACEGGGGKWIENPTEIDGRCAEAEPCEVDELADDGACLLYTSRCV